MNTATTKQIDFINRLKDERVGAEPALEAGRKLWRLQSFDSAAASALITCLLDLPKVEAPVAEVAEVAEVPEGMHRVGGEIYKVQRAIHGSGNPYAKRLQAVFHPDAPEDARCYCLELQGVSCGVCREPDLTEWAFEYAPGVMKYLSEDTKMTLDEAKEWGALYGTCCQCGRTLTDEKSIAAGIGPVCSKKF